MHHHRLAALALLPLLAAYFSLHINGTARAANASAGATSTWVTQSPDGTLAYKTTPKGDRIMDFSHAGYRGGGVRLPNVPIKVTITPHADPKADATARIQAAIDQVSALPPDPNGHRGAILLAPGVYPCSDTLVINASGVVLRGSGTSAPNASIIQMTGPKHSAIRLGDRPETTPKTTAETKITDRYVPSGANTITVENTRGLAIGDPVEVRKTATKEWISLLKMDQLVRDGKQQRWLSPGTKFITQRTIAAIDKNTITLDAPLSDSIDAKYQPPGGATLAKVPPPDWISECGLEHFVIRSPEQAFNHSKGKDSPGKLYDAIRMKAQDSWVRNLRIEETMDSVAVNGRRITLDRVSVIRKARHPGSSKPSELSPNATQILLHRCHVEGDNIWFVATGSRQSGPIVILDSTFKGSSRIEGHQRWTTGMLVDNCNLPGGGIDFKNRGTMGGGHGWGLAWAVAWNSTAKNHTIQQPPGACNWAIGCTFLDTNQKLPQDPGTFDSPNTPVHPRSLYRAQLAARLGPSALEALDAE